MSKVSIGLRGWRFDEREVFTPDGEYRDFRSIDEDVRNRLIRLSVLVGESCDACWLAREDPDDRNEGEYVYGEPLSEVVVCEAHEPDFVYWFREAGGRAFAGEEGFDDRFHEWFLDGNRAPEGYEGMEYVETDGELPDPPMPDPEYLEGHIAEGKPEKRIDLRDGTIERFPEPEPDGNEDDVEPEVEEVDLSVEYPGTGSEP